MDNFLLTNWNGYNFGKNLSEIASDSTHAYDCYFFLTRELKYTNPREWRVAKRAGLIRHVKYYDGGWLDYIVNKQFNTLAEWVADCGDSLENVNYGVNRVHKTYSTGELHEPQFVCLAHFLEALGYKAPPVVNDTFNGILKVLGATKAIPPKGQRCLLKRPDGSIIIVHVRDTQFDSLDNDDSEPNIVISIPTDDGDMKDYARLSDIPRGNKLYFRTTENEFCSVKKLL